jgi:hypothetical protein
MTYEEQFAAYLDAKGFIEYVGKDPCHKLFPDVDEAEEVEEDMEQDDIGTDTEFLQVQTPDMPEPTLRAILEAVAAETKFSYTEIISPRRLIPLVRARMIYCYLAKTMTSKSYPAIGRACGKRDHSTIHHAVKSVNSDAERFQPEMRRVMHRVLSKLVAPCAEQ